MEHKLPNPWLMKKRGDILHLLYILPHLLYTVRSEPTTYPITPTNHKLEPPGYLYLLLN